jgi:LmbE family N-acetylglucosaminyl deacetylase
VDHSAFGYVDLDRRVASSDIATLFPKWTPGDERLMIFSPHDDDGPLGAGYAALAALANGGQLYVAVFCDGWAGYSAADEAAAIVAVRAAETLRAYAALGIPADHVFRLNYPDFSLRSWLGWHIPDGPVGTMSQTVPLMRHLGITRLLAPNHYREHIDHEAAYQSGAYDGPQVGDPVLAEYGRAPAIRSFTQYAVWGDLSPEDALVHGRPASLRANRAIVGPPQLEDRITESVLLWESQQQIIAGIMAARRANRVRNGRAVELYLDFDPRPTLDFAPYHDLIDQLAFS